MNQDNETRLSLCGKSMYWCFRSKFHFTVTLQEWLYLGFSFQCWFWDMHHQAPAMQFVQNMNMSTYLIFGRNSARLHFPRLLDEGFLFFVAYQWHLKFSVEINGQCLMWLHRSELLSCPITTARCWISLGNTCPAEICSSCKKSPRKSFLKEEQWGTVFSKAHSRKHLVSRSAIPWAWRL